MDMKESYERENQRLNQSDLKPTKYQQKYGRRCQNYGQRENFRYQDSVPDTTPISLIAEIIVIRIAFAMFCALTIMISKDLKPSMVL